MAKMKVSSGSKPNSVAGALVGILNDNPAETVEITAVGAGSVNQAIKAVAIARGFVAPTGFDITIQPTFSDVEIDGVEKTAINLVAKKVKI